MISNNYIVPYINGIAIAIADYEFLFLFQNFSLQLFIDSRVQHEHNRRKYECYSRRGLEETSPHQKKNYFI